MRILSLASLLIAAGCSFGDRTVSLRIDPPAGDPAVPRGVSVVLELPADLRPEPHEVIGAVRSAVGTTTADITTETDVREWVREAMARGLRHGGFLVAPPENLGRALHVRTSIRTLTSVEGIGFGATMALEIRILGDRRMLLDKTYTATEHHVVITKASGTGPDDALRACLARIVSGVVKDLTAILEESPD